MLRLGVRNLPPAEAGLIRALLKLMAHGERADLGWSFAEAGPFDGLVVDGSTGVDAAQARSLARAVVALSDGRPSGLPATDVLLRPLRAEQLELWLRRTRAMLAQGTVAAPLPPHVQPQARYKLKRWPPDAVLRSDPLRVRMASMLSRRAMTGAELAAATQHPVDKCEMFLQSLQSLGVLDVQVIAEGAPRSEPASAGERPATSEQWDLVRSIRRRLGL